MNVIIHNRSKFSDVSSTFVKKSATVFESISKSTELHDPKLLQYQLDTLVNTHMPISTFNEHGFLHNHEYTYAYIYFIIDVKKKGINWGNLTPHLIPMV